MPGPRSQSTGVAVLAIGELMVDVSIAGTGHDARIRLAPGGSAANVAVCAAALGAQATVIGRVGDDLAGRGLLAALSEHGVTAEVAIDGGAATGSFALIDGEIRADPAANARFGPEQLPAAVDADAVVVSGYLRPETVAATLDRSRASWLALLPGRLGELPDGPDAVIANEAEARALTGRGPEAAARALGQRFRLACVTRGPCGAVAVLDGRLERADASPSTATRDVPGTGDAFAAGLLVSLAGGATLGEALAAGARGGAAAAERAGAWPTWS
jgi:sugar/nucleoside kinase (ribokinase family)